MNSMDKIKDLLTRYTFSNLPILTIAGIFIFLVNWYLKFIICAFIVSDIYRFYRTGSKAKFLHLKTSSDFLKKIKNDLRRDSIYYIPVLTAIAISFFATQEGVYESCGTSRILALSLALVISSALLWVLIQLKNNISNAFILIISFLVIDTMSIGFNWFYFYDRAKETEQFDYVVQELPIIFDKLLDETEEGGQNSAYYKSNLDLLQKELSGINERIEYINNHKEGSYQDSLYTSTYITNSQKRELNKLEDRIPDLRIKIRNYTDSLTQSVRKDTVYRISDKEKLIVIIDSLKYMSRKQKLIKVPEIKQKLVILAKRDTSLAQYTDKLFFPPESPLRAISLLFNDIWDYGVDIIFEKEEFKPEEILQSDSSIKHEYWSHNRARVVWFSLLISAMLDIIPLLISIIAGFIYRKRKSIP